ncbi:MAG TPA: NAD-dependent epimerase/dehydratase family protein [Flavobacteriales bacterium]|nr:NAD-dependent epimerase/dehydratase family protein [Flavobacteriales bacterium]
MSRILVTGGAGFIGSHLVKKLVEQGHEVVVADVLLRGNKIEKEILPHIEFHKTDVKDLDAMHKLSKGCSLIYHFAAILGVDVVADNPVETMDCEVIGMQNVVEAALTHGVEKVIYASTSGIYGHSAIEKSATETITVDPRTSYAMAKRYNEIYLASNYAEKGLNSIALRFFNVYGKHQDNRMVVPRFYEQATNNEAITVFGNGKQTRDFTYIDDTIFSCTELAEKITGCEIFNIANENETTIFDLANEIISITGSKSRIDYIEAPKKRYDYEMERRCGNSSKLYNAIGYKPHTPLREGLMKTFKN